MASIRNEVQLQTAAADVWDALRDFGALHTRLVPGIVTECKLDGDVRIVTFANGMVAREVLVDAEHRLRRLVYASPTGARVLARVRRRKGDPSGSARVTSGAFVRTICRRVRRRAFRLWACFATTHEKTRSELPADATASMPALRLGTVHRRRWYGWAAAQTRGIDATLIRLYDFLSSGNGYKVRLLLTQLGISFERVEIDILNGESRTEEFLARNPNGRVPVLELNAEERLAESNAILIYLAEGTPYFPKARWQRAKVLEWMFFEQYSHEPNIATPRFWRLHFPLTEDRRPLLEQKMRLGYDALEVMERHLSRRAFFVTDEYTIADIALYAYTHVAHEGGFDLAPFGAVRAWLERVRSQPGHIPITAR